MVTPTFEPGPDRGSSMDSALQGLQAGTSWMGQLQQQRIQAKQEADREQAFQMERDKAIAMLPVEYAKHQADIVTAHASIGLAERMEKLRTQAGAVANTANNEFLEAQQLSDPQGQFDQLGVIQAKYNWMGTLPEYKPFLEAVNKSRGDAFHMVNANNQAEAILDRTKLLVQGRTETAADANATRRDIAGVNAGARVGAAEVAAGSRRDAAETNAGARIGAAEISSTSRENHSAKELAGLHASEDQETMAAQAAMDAGDEALELFHLRRAAQFRDAATKASTYAGEAPSKPDKKPGPVDKQASVAPTKIPSNASTVTIGGKEYPVFKDKNGNRAYKIDGHYVPIENE